MRLAIRASGPSSVSLPVTTWSALTPWALSVVRIVVGLLFLEHGTSKYLGFPATQR